MEQSSLAERPSSPTRARAMEKLATTTTKLTRCSLIRDRRTTRQEREVERERERESVSERHTVKLQ